MKSVNVKESEIVYLYLELSEKFSKYDMILSTSTNGFTSHRKNGEGLPYVFYSLSDVESFINGYEFALNL
jgi:hypothetical protein